VFVPTIRQTWIRNEGLIVESSDVKDDMITLETLQSAVLSDQPWQRLDDLVRAELASGRTTRQIFNELSATRALVDETAGVTEDGTDSLGDTLDSLVGHCRADLAYQNPPTMPSLEELANLPRWARVALVARGARRVLPLFEFGWPQAEEYHIGSLQHAVELAERAAAQGKGLPDINDLDAVVAAVTAHPFPVAAAASRAVARAHEIAIHAESEYCLSIDDHNALVASSAAGQAAGFNLDGSIRRDFDWIQRLADNQNWTDVTPVGPEVFNPLWPEGVPGGWPLGDGFGSATGPGNEKDPSLQTSGGTGW